MREQGPIIVPLDGSELAETALPYAALLAAALRTHLVLVTVWHRQPVAILLNDGHGGFSRVEPGAFPEAFGEPGADWAVVLGVASDAVGVAPQSRAGICADTRAGPRAGRHADSIPRLSAGFLLDAFVVSHAGRAPPL